MTVSIDETSTLIEYDSALYSLTFNTEPSGHVKYTIDGTERNYFVNQVINSGPFQGSSMGYSVDAMYSACVPLKLFVKWCI